MRKIKIEKWKTKIPKRNEKGEILNNDDGQPIIIEDEESLLNAITVLLGNKNPQELPKGLDKFRLFNRLAKAFDKAEKTDELILERDSDYEFIKNIIEKEVPSTWGMNENLYKAIELFLDAKKIEENNKR